MSKLITTAALILAVAACGTPGATGTPAATGTPPEQPGGSAAVTIADFAFDPPASNVSVGTTVTWTNNDNVPHTVTFAGGPDSGTLSNGATFQHTFSEAGTFAYGCTIHPSMAGTITVGN